MRQVPASSSARGCGRYLVIGDGRLARHVLHYFKLENLNVTQWSRSSGRALSMGDATHVLLAISDSAIESVAALVRQQSEARAETSLGGEPRAWPQLVHFSGALVSATLPSAHPLMTFGPELYSLETYRAIPFVLERGRSTLADLLPDLTNRSYAIAPEQKPLYHALCSLSGNFTVMLWEKVFAEFSVELGLPRDVLYPFLAQTAQNLMAGQKSVLTGPLVRGDSITIAKHLKALDGDAFADVYRSFVKAYSAPEPTPFPLGGLV